MSTPTGGPTNPIDAYAPKTPRTAPAQRADVAISEDVAALESKPSSHDPDGSLEPARPQDHRPRQPAANRRDAGMSDLRRLEATLRWIQREEAAARIPRAAQKPERMSRPQGRTALGSALRSSFWSRSSWRRRADITFGGDIGARPRTPRAGRKWPHSRSKATRRARPSGARSSRARRRKRAIT